MRKEIRGREVAWLKNRRHQRSCGSKLDGSGESRAEGYRRVLSLKVCDLWEAVLRLLLAV